MRRLIAAMALSLLVLNLVAQEPVVTSFAVNGTDIEAKLNPVYDLNGQACALVRVNIPTRDVTFEGNIIGVPVWNSGEWLVYMPGASQNLKIKPQGYSTITYTFADQLQPYYSYDLSVSLPSREKIRSLVMPTFSIGTTSHTSYGLMVGFVKKFGGYVRAKSDFNFGLQLSGECDDQGYVEGIQAWLTGASRVSRWAITAGGIAKIFKPLYVYAGVGYGQRTLAWENSDGGYYKVVPSSYSGVEPELGLILRFGAFAVSAGVQTNSFKYWEANLGVGVMF